MFEDNHFDNFWRFFDVLPNFTFTTSVMKCDYFEHGIYEFPQELSNNLKLRVFGN